MTGWTLVGVLVTSVVTSVFLGDVVICTTEHGNLRSSADNICTEGERRVCCPGWRVDPDTRTCTIRTSAAVVDQVDGIDGTGVGSRSCNWLNCEHFCSVTRDHVAYCSCRHGYQLVQNRFCIDRDECDVGPGRGARGGPCTQTCVNTVGSYYCTCRRSYRLLADGRTCWPAVFDGSTGIVSGMGVGGAGVSRQTHSSSQHRAQTETQPSFHQQQQRAPLGGPRVSSGRVVLGGSLSWRERSRVKQELDTIPKKENRGSSGYVHMSEGRHVARGHVSLISRHIVVGSNFTDGTVPWQPAGTGVDSRIGTERSSRGYSSETEGGATPYEHASEGRHVAGRLEHQGSVVSGGYVHVDDGRHVAATHQTATYTASPRAVESERMLSRPNRPPANRQPEPFTPSQPDPLTVPVHPSKSNDYVHTSDGRHVAPRSQPPSLNASPSSQTDDGYIHNGHGGHVALGLNPPNTAHVSAQSGRISAIRVSISHPVDSAVNSAAPVSPHVNGLDESQPDRLLVAELGRKQLTASLTHLTDAGGQSSAAIHSGDTRGTGDAAYLGSIDTRDIGTTFENSRTSEGTVSEPETEPINLNQKPWPNSRQRYATNADDDWQTTGLSLLERSLGARYSLETRAVIGQSRVGDPCSRGFANAGVTCYNNGVPISCQDCNNASPQSGQSSPDLRGNAEIWDDFQPSNRGEPVVEEDGCNDAVVQQTNRAGVVCNCADAGYFSMDGCERRDEQPDYDPVGNQWQQPIGPLMPDQTGFCDQQRPCCQAPVVDTPTNLALPGDVAERDGGDFNPWLFTNSQNSDTQRSLVTPPPQHLANGQDPGRHVTEGVTSSGRPFLNGLNTDELTKTITDEATIEKSASRKSLLDNNLRLATSGRQGLPEIKLDSSAPNSQDDVIMHDDTSPQNADVRRLARSRDVPVSSAASHQTAGYGSSSILIDGDTHLRCPPGRRLVPDERVGWRCVRSSRPGVIARSEVYGNRDAAAARPSATKRPLTQLTNAGIKTAGFISQIHPWTRGGVGRQISGSTRPRDPQSKELLVSNAGGVCTPACMNAGVCVSGRCRCPPAFTGNVCQTELSCNKTCYNGGVCVNDRCVCTPGYFGPHCRKDKNECLRSQPCSHECINTRGSYTCRCPVGYTLNADKRTCSANKDF